jgi:hypothetical protein
VEDEGMDLTDTLSRKRARENNQPKTHLTPEEKKTSSKYPGFSDWSASSSACPSPSSKLSNGESSGAVKDNVVCRRINMDEEEEED